jgi:hypothetical protein
MLRFAFSYFYDEWHYAECCYAKCWGAILKTFVRSSYDRRMIILRQKEKDRKIDIPGRQRERQKDRHTRHTCMKAVKQKDRHTRHACRQTERQ